MQGIGDPFVLQVRCLRRHQPRCLQFLLVFPLMLIYLCLLPVHMAYSCTAAFGATPGSRKFCRSTPHSHSSPQACCLPEGEGQGTEEGPIHNFALSLFIHLSSYPSEGKCFYCSKKAPLLSNLFLLNPLAIFQILSCPLRAFITQNITHRSFVLVLLFTLSHHSSTLR